MLIRFGLLLLALVLTMPVDAQERVRHSVQPTSKVKLDKHKLSYAIGYRLGSQFADGQPDVDMDTVIRALRDAFGKRQPQVSLPLMRQQLQALDRQMHDQALAAFRTLAAKNAQKSASFMLTNADRPGVELLPSGVQYEVLQKGTGVHPTHTSVVVINYRGSLINGMEFDSSYAYGHPVTYPVKQMLPGWQDVLPRMQVGDKWRVFIPPDQAYGSQGELPRIGPNEALIFVIELVGVK